MVMIRKPQPVRKVPKFVRYGIPFLVLMVAGSFGLSEFTDIRVKKKDEKVRRLTSEETLKYKKKREAPITLEEAFQEIKKDIDIDTWENKRGPRPWEEAKET